MLDLERHNYVIIKLSSIYLQGGDDEERKMQQRFPVGQGMPKP